jgi:hypothetical protein
LFQFANIVSGLLLHNAWNPGCMENEALDWTCPIVFYCSMLELQYVYVCVCCAPVPVLLACCPGTAGIVGRWS